jgi:hypothetical protein
MCYCYDVYYAHVTKLGMADLGLECVEVWVLGRGGQAKPAMRGPR